MRVGGERVRLVLVLQVGATLAMFGLIWFVQVVHYPLFLSVGAQQFPAYEAAHATRTTWVVAPLMLVELGTACLFLLPGVRPAGVRAFEAWVGLGLVGVIWFSTALLQVPLHDRLQAGYSADLIGRLVATNWVRTVAWSLRAALVLRWVWLCL